MSGVSKAMRRVKHSDGSNIFDKCTSHNYKKQDFFLACQQRNEGIERNELITEKAIEKMSNEVTKALVLQPPIMYKTYNICEIVGQSRLAKFSI